MNRMNEEFEKIYNDYYDFVYRFLVKHTNGNLDISEELTQETFYQIFLYLHRYRGECNIKTWICKIALNVMCKHSRKNPHCISLEEVANHFIAETTASAEDTYIAASDLSSLRKALLKLRKNYRDVIMCRVYLQLSFAKIGELLNISESYAKVLYYRGKEKLKSYIK